MIDPAHVRAITLDLDDTLWPIAPTIVQAEAQLQAWLSQHAPRTAKACENPEFRRTARAQVNAAHSAQAHDLSHLRREAIRACLEAAGDDPGLAEPAFEVFFEARQRVTLYPGKREALQRLSQRYPLIALSNGNADVFRTEAGPFFKAAVSARAVGVAKPDPRIFAAAAQAAGVPAQFVLHVGDDPHSDVHGARQAGMMVVWLTPEPQTWSSEAPPPWQLTHLSELCDHLLG